jgi:hypothetical protein
VASVLLECTAEVTQDRPYSREDFRRIQVAADRDRFRVHTRTDDPAKADIILFVGAGEDDFLDVRRHPYVRQYRDRCFLFDSGDRIIPFLPGVYAGIERDWFSRQRVRSGFYLRVFENSAIVFDPARYDTDHLFSFAGAAANAPVRRRLLGLRHPRGVVVNTDELARRWPHLPAEEQRRRQDFYGKLTMRSKFVLCPRGRGVSSWRLFETMKAGRVPVIVSDQWVLPDGPDWPSFSMRVSERSVAAIPELLEQWEPHARNMGLRARQAFDDWFGEETCFHRIVDSCLDIQKRRVVSETWAHWPVLLQYFRPFPFRHYLLRRLRAALKRVLSR